MTGAEARKIREKMGASQLAWANMLKVVPETISRWERGVTEIPGPAEILLWIIDRSPEVTKEILDAARDQK